MGLVVLTELVSVPVFHRLDNESIVKQAVQSWEGGNSTCVMASCGSTCAAHGLNFNWYVAADTTPMTPLLLGKNPARKDAAWAIYV